MANIQKLLEPINRENTVNIINIYKEDYLPNIYVNPKKIKGKQYSIFLTLLKLKHPYTVYYIIVN